jgi:hypothetical protein
VQTLALRGLKEITRRLEEADARLDDPPAMLRDPPDAVDWLRRQRDTLFRVNRAWEPVFKAWAGASGQVDDFMWRVVETTYAFLAPRFMSVQEWAVVDAKPKQAAPRAQVW